MKIVDNVPESVPNHVVLERTRAHAVPETGLFEKIGGQAHVLHPAGHHHFGITELNGLGCQHDGL